MNDVGFSLDVMDRIIVEARGDMSFAEQAGLYAGAKVVVQQFRQYVDRDHAGDGYAREKLHEYEWHIASAMGFDITNGHDTSQHLDWALIALNSFRQVMRKRGALND